MVSKKVFDSVFQDGILGFAQFPGQGLFLHIETQLRKTDGSDVTTEHVHRFIEDDESWKFESLVHASEKYMLPSVGINDEVFHAYRRIALWEGPHYWASAPADLIDPDNPDPWHFIYEPAIEDHKHKLPESNIDASFSEAHTVQTPNGMIVQLSRFRNNMGDRRLRQVNLKPTSDNPKALIREFDKWNYDEKADGIIYGRTYPTKLIGYPAHLLVLSNDWLVAVYTDRYSNGRPRILAAVNRDTTNYSPNEWEDGIVLSECFEGQDPADAGYACSVELQKIYDEEITIFTAFYRLVSRQDKKPSIMGISWGIQLEIGSKWPLKE